MFEIFLCSLHELSRAPRSKTSANSSSYILLFLVLFISHAGSVSFSLFLLLKRVHEPGFWQTDRSDSFRSLRNASCPPAVFRRRPPPPLSECVCVVSFFFCDNQDLLVCRTSFRISIFQSPRGRGQRICKLYTSNDNDTLFFSCALSHLIMFFARWLLLPRWFTLHPWPGRRIKLCAQFYIFIWSWA